MKGADLDSSPVRKGGTSAYSFDMQTATLSKMGGQWLSVIVLAGSARAPKLNELGEATSDCG